MPYPAHYEHMAIRPHVPLPEAFLVSFLTLKISTMQP